MKAIKITGPFTKIFGSIVLALVLVACGGSAPAPQATAPKDTAKTAFQANKNVEKTQEVKRVIPENPKTITLDEDTVFFDYDSATLTTKAMVTLNQQIDFLKTNRDTKVVLEGHTDERGTREYNLALGERRADAVQTYMIQKGVDASRIKIVSYGKERPLENLDAEEQRTIWSMNRRVKTLVM